MITSTRDAITIYCLHCQQTHQIPADAEEQCPQCQDAYCGGEGSRPCIEVQGQAPVPAPAGR